MSLAREFSQSFMSFALTAIQSPYLDVLENFMKYEVRYLHSIFQA